MQYKIQEEWNKPSGLKARGGRYLEAYTLNENIYPWRI